MLNNINFNKWLALKYNKQSQECLKNYNYFHFSSWNLFSPCSVLIKCNLKNLEQCSLKEEQKIHCEIFSLKTASKCCYKGL